MKLPHLATLWLLATSAASCGIITDIVEDDRAGARLLQRSVLRPAWSADNATIYYTTRSGTLNTTFTLAAVDIDDMDTRQLTSVSGFNTGGEQVRTISDPSVVFFAIAKNGHYTIYRASAAGGAAEILASDASWPWFLVSANGARIAYRGRDFSSDSVMVRDVATPATTAGFATPGNPVLLDMSAAGDRVVYGAGGHEYEINTTTGEQRRVLRSIDPTFASTVAPQVLWQSGAPYLLVASLPTGEGARSLDISTVNGYTGERSVLGAIPNAINLPFAMAWSKDGQSFAAWVPVEIVGNNMERTIYKFRLYAGTANNSLKPLLEWEADESLYWLEFSPNGRRLGLVLYGELYVVDVE